MSRYQGGRVRLGDEDCKIALSRSSLSGSSDRLLHALVFRFQLSLRDIEELLFERGVIVGRRNKKFLDPVGAYDRQKEDETHWQNQAVRSLPALLVDEVSYPHHVAFIRLNRPTAIEPA